VAEEQNGFVESGGYFFVLIAGDIFV